MSTDPAPTDASVRAAAAARTGYGRLLALLASTTHDLAAAEDALADAFEKALLTWPDRGVPDNPEGWLLTVSRNRLRDRWKSAAVSRTTWLEEAPEPISVDDIDPDAIGDRRLELMLVCAHPAIAESDRTPLMLATVLGFTAEQVATGFAVPTSTMATRLTRAKRRIKANRIPFQIPDRHVLPERMSAVLEAVYGAYAIEHLVSDPHAAVIPEGLQLADVLAAVAPDDPEAHGLAALVKLSAARRRARVDSQGSFVPLQEQDPTQWDRALIAQAHEHLRRAHSYGVLGRFQVEAAIQVVHCARADSGTTDWLQLAELYEVLCALAPTLGNATARAAVLAEVDGPLVGLAALEELPQGSERYQPAWATRAHLSAVLGRAEEAGAAYDRAVDLTQDQAVRAWLEARRASL